ncbi:MAG: tetratricopeptide repeat protein [bacterium]|nr:tetratricopeptide repeat protein [bacterium]
MDIEPTPEFNRRCMEIINSWERGELPFKEAITHLTAYGQEAVHDNHIANQGRAEHLMGYLQHYRGNLNTSIHHYERARSLYMQAGNRPLVAITDLNQGENYRYKGDFTRARRLYRAAYEASRDLGDIRIQTIAAANEGLVLLTIGHSGSARQSLEEGLRLAEQWTDRLEQLPGILCEIYHGLASIDLAENRHEAAWGKALRALEAAHNSQQPMHLGFANRTMGEVISRLGRPLEAGFAEDPDEYFRASLEAFKEVNAEAETARTMFSQAQALARQGRRTAAARKLQQVMITFTQLGMVDDAARAAEAQLAVL